MSSFFKNLWEEFNRSPIECRTCKGAGIQTIGSAEFQCLTCGGSGKNPHFSPPPENRTMPSFISCAMCNGTGKTLLLGGKCPHCNGIGFIFSNPQPPPNIPNIPLNNTCPDCDGYGWVNASSPKPSFFNQPQKQTKQTCGKCNGKGRL